MLPLSLSHIPLLSYSQLLPLLFFIQIRLLYVSRPTYTQTFRAVLFIIVKNWKWLKCPSVMSG